MQCMYLTGGADAREPYTLNLFKWNSSILRSWLSGKVFALQARSQSLNPGNDIPVFEKLVTIPLPIDTQHNVTGPPEEAIET